LLANKNSIDKTKGKLPKLTRIGLTIECTQITILSEKRIRLIAVRNIDTYATR